MCSAFRYTFFLLSIWLAITGMMLAAQDLFLAALVLVFLADVLYCFENIKQRIVLLFFIFIFSIFLLWRPFFDIAAGDPWQYGSMEATNFALIVVFLTLVLLPLGSLIAQKIFATRKQHNNCTRSNSTCSNSKRDITAPEGFSALNKNTAAFVAFCGSNSFMRALRISALVVYFLGLLASFFLGFSKLAFMSGHTYVEYYLEYAQTAPLIIRIFATAMFYALCAYLATMPRKKPTVAVLLLYVLTTVPMLLIGGRGDFALALAFTVCYYILRNFMGDEENWFGKLEKAFVLIMIPVALVLFALVRPGTVTFEDSLIAPIVNLLRAQGVSFKVLCLAYDAIPSISDLPDKLFVLGPFIDYIRSGPIGTGIFGLTDLGTTNSVLIATQSNSFAHCMSYVAHPRYLMGEGYGSSYLLEFYADLGYAGVIFADILWGFLLTAIPLLLKRGFLSRYFALLIISGLFWTPRSSALGWLQFIITPQFWFTCALVLVGSFLILQMTRRGPVRSECHSTITKSRMLRYNVEVKRPAHGAAKVH